MPYFYEDAAHMMLFLTRAGLTIRPDIDVRIVLKHLANRLKADAQALRCLSHFAAAGSILDDLEARAFVRCEATRRVRVTKLLGTALANFLAAHAKGAK